MSTEQLREHIREALADMGQTRMGMAGYLCMLAYLRDHPCTSAELAVVFRLSEHTAREIVNRMGELGLAHTTGEKVRRNETGPRFSVWGYGPGPVERVGIPCRKKLPALTQLKYVLEVFQGEPIRLRDAAVDCGSTWVTVQKLAKLGRRLNILRIAEWERLDRVQSGGVPAALWQVGSGPDARKPKPIPHPVLKRAYRLRVIQRTADVAILHALAGVRKLEAA